MRRKAFLVCRQPSRSVRHCAGASSPPQRKGFFWRLDPARTQGVSPPSSRPSAVHFAGGSTRLAGQALCVRLAKPPCKAFTRAPSPSRSAAMSFAGKARQQKYKQHRLRLNAAAVQASLCVIQPSSGATHGVGAPGAHQVGCGLQRGLKALVAGGEVLRTVVKPAKFGLAGGV